MSAALRPPIAPSLAIVFALFPAAFTAAPQATEPLPTSAPQAGDLSTTQTRARESSVIPFLDASLDELFRSWQNEQNLTALSAMSTALSFSGDRVKVSLLMLDAASAAATVTLLPSLDAEVTAHYHRLIDAWVPVARLPELGTLAGLSLAHQPTPSIPLGDSLGTSSSLVGTFFTAGVAASNADQWHLAGFRGQRISLAVIDSFKGYLGAQLAGELPIPLTLFNVLELGSEHGTACAEIVADMAPNASLSLASATTATELAQVIVALGQAGNDVISSSVTQIDPSEPGDGSGDLNQAVAEARNSHGTFYVQAAGNHAQFHWDGAFQDADGDTYNEFQPGIEVNELTQQLAAGERLTVWLRWNAWPTTNQDYDVQLYYFNGTQWTYVTESGTQQTGSQPPWEQLNSYSVPLAGRYALAIKRYSGTETHQLSLMVFSKKELTIKQTARSLVTPAEGAASFSVAAVDVRDSAFPLELYSSRGPAYGPGGILEGGNAQPRIAAYANVDTWSYAPNGPAAFNGTSAATPHVAGAAALVRSRYPTLSTAQVATFLESNAIDLGVLGPDSEYGFGRLSLGTPPYCAYSANPTSSLFSSIGASGSFTLSTEAGCDWIASSTVSWVNITGGGSGLGSGTVSFTVDPNPDPARSASIEVLGLGGAGATFTVNQAAASCTYGLSSYSTSVGADATTGSVNVTTNVGSCAWTAVSNHPSWLAVTGGAAGTGNGTVSYSVQANSGVARTGTITIAGQTFTVNQAAASCTYGLSSYSTSVGADATTGSVNVTTNVGSCAWTAVSNHPSWLAVTGGAAGTGNGTVSYSVQANSGVARTGTIAIDGQTFTVNQAAASCTYGLSSSSTSAAAAGGSGSIGVSTNLASCTWTTVSNAPSWLTVTSGQSGTGSAVVSYFVAANLGETRNGTLTIAGQFFTVSQAAASCTYGLSEASAFFGAAGGSSSVTVTTNLTSCSWTAASNNSWLTITSGASGTGNGTVFYSVAPNSGEQRTGTLMIAGQLLTVTQAASACSGPTAPTNLSPPAGAAVPAGSVTLSWSAASGTAPITYTVKNSFGTTLCGAQTGTSCTITATGPVTWFVQASNACGSVNGASTTFTIQQCSPPGSPSLFGPAAGAILSPGSVTFTWGAAGGTEPITYDLWTAAGSVLCSTSATSCAVSLTAGTYTWYVRASNSCGVADSLSRTLTLQPDCTYSLDTTGASVGSAGGTGSLFVSTNVASCAWTAVSNAAWLTVTSGASSVGSSAVGYSVAANSGTQRVGTLTIAGQTFTVTQAAGVCTYGLSSSGSSIGAAGGNGTVNVTSSLGSCAWTAASNAAWITVTGGASGTGDATVSYSVGTNSGTQRVGTLTIAGQTFTVTQAAAGCTFSLSATGASVSATAGTGEFTVTATPASCSWSAVTNQESWLLVIAGASGTGAGTVRYFAFENTGDARTGTITAGGLAFTVTQAAAACSVTLGATAAALPAIGGTTNVTVTANRVSCQWGATSNAPSWLSISGSNPRTGSGSLTLTAAANPGGVRTGTATIAGTTFTVTQAAACQFATSTAAASLPPGGGTRRIDVAANDAACTWSATAGAAWVQLGGTTSGSGSGTLYVSAAANPGPQRASTVVVAGTTVAVTQANGACGYTIQPTSASAPAVGGGGSIMISVQAPSPSPAAESGASEPSGPPLGDTAGAIAGVSAADGWLAVTEHTIGSMRPPDDGSAPASSYTLSPADEIAYSWLRFPGAAAGDRFDWYWRDPAGELVAHSDLTLSAANTSSIWGGMRIHGETAAGRPGRWSVTVQRNAAVILTESFSISQIIACTWSATSSAEWLTITSAASGTGDAELFYSVAANPAPVVRSATLTVAGRTFTVTQAAAVCNIGLGSTATTVPATAGAHSVQVNASHAQCPWTAVSNAAWITIPGSASRIGSLVLSFSVAANTGDQRVGTLTVAGRTFTVTQAAATCSYSLQPPSAQIAAVAGDTGVNVVTNRAVCSWSAVSNDLDWLTIVSGSTGTGSGVVTYRAATNYGPQRQGTLTIAGLTFTVTQAVTSCTATLSPKFVRYPAAGGVGTITLTLNDPWCPWTAESSAPAWLKVTSETSGTGSGRVGYRIEANTGGPRAASLTIGSAVFQVQQDAPPCWVAVSPVEVSFLAAGGTGTVTVTPNDESCSWEAVSQAPAWLTLVGRSSGTGTGTFSFSVAANPDASRTGTIAVEGQPVTVRQTAPARKVRRNL